MEKIINLCKILWKYSLGGIIYLLIMFCKALYAVSRGLTKQYIAIVKNNANRRKTILRRIFAWCGMILVPIIAVLPTVVATIIIAVTFSAVDQVFYMNTSRDPWVIAKVQEFQEKGAANLTDNERVAAIIHATWLQMEKELNGKGGWMSNDVGISLVFDNPQNREEMVRYATYKLLVAESDLFSRLSGGDAPEDPLLLKAHSKGNLAVGDIWGAFTPLSSETNYKEAIKLMKEYEGKLLGGGGHPNATPGDIKAFLNVVINDILKKMTDPVKGRGYKVPFAKVDDQIYNATGGAAELNNVLPIVFAGYAHMMGQGTEKHIENTLNTINTVAKANPFIVWAFDGFSLPDARSKMARYLYEVDDYLQKIREAVPASSNN